LHVPFIGSEAGDSSKSSICAQSRFRSRQASLAPKGCRLVDLALQGWNFWGFGQRRLLSAATLGGLIFLGHLALYQVLEAIIFRMTILDGYVRVVSLQLNHPVRLGIIGIGTVIKGNPCVIILIHRRV
jgi:hypothetical protein